MGYGIPMSMRLATLLAALVLALVPSSTDARGPRIPDTPKTLDPPTVIPSLPEFDIATARSGLWFVVRASRPEDVVYGPWMSDEPECRGYERRFVGLYRCVRR